MAVTGFVPTPAELALTQQVFDIADKQKIGVLIGDSAIQVFARANLPTTVLGEIWALADADNNGFLSRKGVTVALRLIAWAQKGETPSAELISKPGPLASLEGIQTPVVPTRAAPKSPTPAAMGGLPSLTPADKAKFLKLFNGCEPTNGLLPGDKARDVFVKSKLSFEQLSKIWQLADTKNRGSLDAPDFTIAMYLIQGLMAGRITSLPATLPPGLIEQAGGIATHSTGASFSSSRAFPGAPLQGQMTGQPLQPQGTGATPLRSAFGMGSPFPAAVAPVWDVTAQEKTSSDGFFDQLDPQRRGFIEGEVAVPFMLQSQLPEDALAQVWDLADLNNDGRLTREGFAVAMHLINGKLAGKEIPVSLSPTLIPPSMRGAAAPMPAVTPPVAQLSQTMRDLLGDDSPPASAVPESAGRNNFKFMPTSPPMVQAQATGGTLSHQATGPLSNQHTGALPYQQTGSLSTPGTGIFPAPTGAFAAAGPFGSPAVQSPSMQSPFQTTQATAPRDLMGDDDEPTTSPPLEDRSAEVGNTQNQLNSTNKSLEIAKAERASADQNVTNQAAQLATLQTQLASAKAAYETETRLLTTLRERFSAQTADINKAREELIHAESELSALRVEKNEVQGSLLRDKEEVRDLQRKMKDAGEDVEQTKLEVEKAKKDLKQQKGLLAIARKQLSSREADKAKAAKELEEAAAELVQATKDREAAEELLLAEPETAITPAAPVVDIPAVASTDALDFAASQPLPTSPPSVSPQITGVSKNPFDRLTSGSATATPRMQSPFLPFASSAVPTPTGAPSDPVVDDPFGLNDEPEIEPPATVLEAPVQPTAAEKRLSTASSPMSPTDDALFSTPPSSNSPLPDDQLSQDLENERARFPSIDALTASAPTDTDLSSQVKDLEPEESDSDNSDQEDNKPLATLVNGNADKTSEATPTLPSKSLTNGGDNSPSNLTSSVTSSAFDDVFGMSSSVGTTESTVPTTHDTSSNRSISPKLPQIAPSKDAFGLFDTLTPAAETTPSAPPVIVSPVQTATQPAGVSDFDEAMGKIPPSASSSNFKFETAFDDNFDFAAATGTDAIKFEPPTTNGTHKSTANGFASTFGTSSPAQTNGLGSPFAPAPTAAASPPARGLSFNDAFSGVAAPSAPAAAASIAQGASFDDAFGLGNNSSPIDSTFGDSFSSQASRPKTEPAASAPFPTTVSPPISRPSSPAATLRSNTMQSRGSSTPPRTSSPRPRLSTASSKEASPSEKPTRSSRLSIRLPFGGKNKDKKKGKNDKGEAPPVPSLGGNTSHLAPLSESDSTNVTPAVEDDVEAVKQLCSMGFSRTEAVNALEAHSYDVQRSLNYLLGTR